MILVVENDPTIKMLLCYIIEDLNIACYSVETNQAAIQLIPYARPSIVLVDYLLADGQALSLLHFLKENHPDIKVILTSALNYSEIKSIIQEFNIEHFIAKPFQIEHLEKLLQTI